MASSMIFSYEKRAVKRPKLGPPDVYPQDPKQREDELTAVNVKQGFSHIPQLSDEFGTAKACNINAAKLGAFMNGALSRRGEANTFPDTGKRRLQVNTKDHFWHVTHTPRHKQVLEAWMRDLAGGKALSSIAKKVPIFNKREEIFLTLAEHNVPMIRAGWFLKMTASYNSAISEAKTKKRQMPDPSQEWTISLARCCKDILIRVSDWYNGGTGAVSNSLSTGSSSGTGSSASPLGSSLNGPSSNFTIMGLSDDGNVSLRQWLYCMDLAKYLYEEGLLDRYEWLVWVIDVCDKTKSVDDPTWKALLPVMLSYLPDVAQSELLSRRLATLAARKLSSMFTDQDFIPAAGCGMESLPPPSGLMERLKCPTHRPTVLGLCSAIQVVLLECPTAMVYNGNPMAPQSESGRNSVPGGSPLDILPIQPSIFPMPPRANNEIIRRKLAEAEDLVIARSRAVEAKWSCDEWQQSSAGSILQKVLSALDSLDKHNFDKIDSSNSLDTLYSQIFPNPPVKDNPTEADAPTVLLLCKWAVGSQRTGEHRALAVARLLEHRQSDILTALNETEGNSNNSASNSNQNQSSTENTPVKIEPGTEDVHMQDPDAESSNPSKMMNGGINSGESAEDGTEFPNGVPIFHNLLLRFLDTDAPTLDDTPQGRNSFASLVTLFSALIRHDVFSHDSYLCTLIARGDLAILPQPSGTSNGPVIGPPSSVQPIPSVATPGPASQAGPATPASVSSAPSTTPHHGLEEDRDRGPLFPPLPRMPEPPRQADFDDPNIDDDLDRILQHITQDQMDQVDSPKDDSGTSGPGGFGSITPNPHNSGQAPLSNSTNSSDPSNGGGKGALDSKQSRHRQYVTHFQLPQDESFAHESNQRHVLLYGVGRAREEARHAVKKVSKELNKLFSKKFCHDVSDGSRVKKHSKNEINFDNLTGKYSALPYYDQHAVTTAIAQTAVEMFTSFVTGRSNYLPTVEHIGYLTDLMEIGLNYVGLLEFCISIMRDLPDIEVLLCQRGSSISGSYTTSMQLILVAVLRRYHCCLLLDGEMTMMAWENLVRLMRRIKSSHECSSAERCALAYITELQSCCGFLRSKNVSEYLSPDAAKLRQSLNCEIRPPDHSSHNWNRSFMTQCLEFPKKKVDASTLRQLTESPSCRYSFVCNAVLAICNEADSDRVNDLASLCAEMTASCPSLAAEWLWVLRTLCSPKYSSQYVEVLSVVDVKHLSIHSSLATLTALLVARQCFSSEDVVKQAVFSLMTPWNDGELGRSPHDPDIEAGIRLTCQLLLSLFKTQGNPNTSSSNSPNILKQSCDRRLLSATHKGLTLGAVCAAMKAMILIADAAGSGERRRDQRNLSDLSHILGTSDLPASASDIHRGEPRTLASFGYQALQQMCCQPWVRQRFLQHASDLWNGETLLDPLISSKQAQRLLHLICYPEIPLPDEGLDPRTHIPRLMENLDQWNLREALLTLTLQNRQLTSGYNNSGNTVEHGNWLDIVARSALDVFNLSSEDGSEFLAQNSAAPSPAPGKSPRSGKKSSNQDIVAKTPPSNLNLGNPGSSNPLSISSGSNSSFAGGNAEKDKNSQTQDGAESNDPSSQGWTPTAAWLLAPLVTKLSSAVQGRVLRHAGNVLEAYFKRKTMPGQGGSSSGNNSSSLQAHLPFLALILTCLRGQDEQREGLLASLLTQFSQILSLAKLPDVDPQSEALRDVLRLRLSLVGGMFDAIQRSSTATAEWAIILTQLVTNGVVDLNNNSDIFPTVIDMITALVHSTQIAEPGDRIEEMKRQNMNLIKKLKKELADKDTDSIQPLRQLLPFSKVQVDIIVTTATSMIVDSKGNRVQSFEFVDKKPGLQVWEKQRCFPWEIIEGQKNPAQISWGWFGAVKMDRKPLRYEDAHRLLRYHTHCTTKPTTHFLEPVPLPPEDVDMKAEPLKEEALFKPDQSPMSDQSPLIMPGVGPIGRNAKPKAPRKRRQTKAQAAAAAAAAAQQPPPPISSPNQPPSQMPPVNSFNPPQVQNQMPPVPMPGQGPPPNYPQQGPNTQPWYNGNPNQGGPPPQQQFFPQGPNPGPGRPPSNQPKQVLSQFLANRARHPSVGMPAPNPNQFGQFPQNPGPGGQGQPSVGPGPGPGSMPVARHQNILRQQLRGPNPMQAQNFQAGQQPMQVPGNPNQQQMMFQQQQTMQTPQGMQQQQYGFNQANMGGQGGGNVNVNVMGSQAQANPQLNQMLGNRGGPPPNQELTNFMQGPPQQRPQMAGPPQQRPNFMQSNPQGMTYARGQMQMGPGPGQMGMGQNPQMGQMGQGGPMQNQMGQMGQMGQMQPGPGAQAQRMRQFVMQQQQQQQQGQPGMGMGGPRMQYPNQPGPGGY